MKLLFDKLKTSDGIVRVSFDGEVTWNEYNVADVKDTGITFTEDDCPDLTKIRIAGAITKISDIKTHIINEAISQDLSVEEQVQNLQLQLNSFSNSASNEELDTLKNRFENFLWNYNASNNSKTTQTGTWYFGSLTAIDLFGEEITPSKTSLYREISEYTISIPLNKLNNIKLRINNNYIYPKNIVSDTLPDKSIVNARINSIADIEKFSELYDIPEYNMNEKAQQPWYGCGLNYNISFKMGTIYKVLDYIGCSKDPILYDYPPTLKLTPMDIVYIITGIDYTSVNDMSGDHKSIYDYFNNSCINEGRDYFEFSFLTNGLLLWLLDETNDGSIELVLNEALINLMINKINTYEIPTDSYSAVWNTTSNSPDNGDIQYWLDNIGVPEVFYNGDHSPAIGTTYLRGFTTFLLRKFLSQQTAYDFKEWLWWDLHPSHSQQTIYYPTISDVAAPLEGIIDTTKLYMTKDENNLTITYYSDENSRRGIDYQQLKY